MKVKSLVGLDLTLLALSLRDDEKRRGERHDHKTQAQYCDGQCFGCSHESYCKR